MCRAGGVYLTLPILDVAGIHPVEILNMFGKYTVRFSGLRRREWRSGIGGCEPILLDGQLEQFLWWTLRDHLIARPLRHFAL